MCISQVNRMMTKALMCHQWSSVKSGEAAKHLLTNTHTYTSTSSALCRGSNRSVPLAPSLFSTKCLFHSFLTLLTHLRPEDSFSMLLRRHGGSRRNSLLRWCQRRTKGYKVSFRLWLTFKLFTFSPHISMKRLLNSLLIVRLYNRLYCLILLCALMYRVE